MSKIKNFYKKHLRDGFHDAGLVHIHDEWKQTLPEDEKNALTVLLSDLKLSYNLGDVSAKALLMLAIRYKYLFSDRQRQEADARGVVIRKDFEEARRK